MPNTKKSNKAKRKRGKKFIFHGADGENAPKKQEDVTNPFEEHSKTKTMLSFLPTAPMREGELMETSIALSSHDATRKKKCYKNADSRIFRRIGFTLLPTTN